MLGFVGLRHMFYVDLTYGTCTPPFACVHDLLCGFIQSFALLFVQKHVKLCLRILPGVMDLYSLGGNQHIGKHLRRLPSPICC